MEFSAFLVLLILVGFEQPVLLSVEGVGAVVVIGVAPWWTRSTACRKLLHTALMSRLKVVHVLRPHLMSGLCRLKFSRLTFAPRQLTLRKQVT